MFEDLNLSSTIFSGSKLGLNRIQKLLEMIDNPQKNLKYIHVAGTNGKGSTCFMLSSIFSKAGYKTGLYISPNIIDFCERIQINNKMISKANVKKLVDFFRPFLNHDIFKSDPITEFELTTAIAFKYFEEQKCDIVILETGLGGKFDATNVISNNLCSVITPISYDHTQILGNNIEKIANEKLGIIKPYCPIVLAPDMDKSIYKLAKQMADKNNSPIRIAKTTKIQNISYSLFDGTSFTYEDVNYKTNLLGEHQIQNLATVFEVIKTIKNNIDLSSKNVIDGIAEVTIPCRLEIVSRNPLIILDAAHNPAGVVSLKKFIDKYLKNKHIIGIIGMLTDKDVNNSMKFISHIFNKILTVTPPVSRGLSAKSLAEIIKQYNSNVTGYENIQTALSDAKYLTDKNTCILIFGSFYIMDDIKKQLAL